jgi:hypothetical protein
MWVTVFALAMAVSVSLGAVNLAVQLGKDRAAVNAVIESRRQTPEAPYGMLSSATAEGDAQAIAQFD